MAEKVEKPYDVTGRRIRVGDLVRIIGIPDLSGLAPDGLKESLPVFRHLVGKYKKVEGFDEYGCAEFWFRIQSEQPKTYHWVCIEPYLLRVKRSREELQRDRGDGGKPKSLRR